MQPRGPGTRRVLGCRQYPATFELLHTLAHAGYAAGLPAPEVIEGWKKTFMAVWEATVDDLDPSPAYKTERRTVLHRTFDDLAAVSRHETTD
ncbi:hypothetical protein SFUMM280S_02300 [Streptomyces fumanus]